MEGRGKYHHLLINNLKGETETNVEVQDTHKKIVIGYMFVCNVFYLHSLAS